MIREATLKDRPALQALALRYMRQAYPGLLPDKTKISDLVTEAVSSKSSLALISLDGEGVPWGGLIALGRDGSFFQRKHLTMMLFGTEVPGDGAKMLREFVRFAKSRPAYKVIDAGFPVEPRLGRLLERVGLSRIGDMHTMMR